MISSTKTMNNLTNKTENQFSEQKNEFWSKVERVYGEIPWLIKLILDFNGFDSFLSLRGIHTENKKEFFDGIEESVRGLQDYEEDDELRLMFEDALKTNYQRIDNFRLKLGHKNLIVNLFQELQNTPVEDFNERTKQDEPSSRKVVNEEKVSIPDTNVKFEKHRCSLDVEENNEIPTKKLKLEAYEETATENPEVNKIQHLAEDAGDESTEMVQYIYESDVEEEDAIQFTDHEYLESYEQDDVIEMVFEGECQQDDENEDNGTYSAEEIIKSDSYQFENSKIFEIPGYEKLTKTKRPKHMYTEEFLANQSGHGLARIGTPGRRRPKLSKNYPDTDEGLLERWADLVRQSCEVIVPPSLLMQHDLTEIFVTKLHENVWEVKCPLCTKKVKLQLTHEGKYINYKRSNFERHLRIVHYRQIVNSKQNFVGFKRVVAEDNSNSDSN